MAESHRAEKEFRFVKSLSRCRLGRAVTAHAEFVTEVEEVDPRVVRERTFDGVCGCEDVVLGLCTDEVAPRLIAQISKSPSHCHPKYLSYGAVMHRLRVPCGRVQPMRPRTRAAIWAP